MAVRMFYGNPLGDTFMNWGWWDVSGSTPPAQMIITTPGASGYTLTPFGQKWVDLMNEFSTSTQNVTVNADGSINFNGFYGEYAVQGTLNGNAFTFVTVGFEKGPNNTATETLWVKGDFNLDGKLDVACAAQAEDSYFFYGKGNGSFGSGIAIANTIKNQGGYGVASGDFNNDHAPDLAIPIEEYGKVAIMLNTK